MLRATRYMIFLSATLLATGGDSSAKSHWPSPSNRESIEPPQSQSTQTKEPASQYPSGTEQSPIIVKILPSPDAEKKAADEAKHEQQKATNDDRLARFTERLFWATVALSVIAALQLFVFGVVFGWQGVQLKRTVRATEKSADAAKRAADAAKQSADATFSLERPFFHLGKVDFMQPAGGNDPRPFVDFAFINAGRTAAIVREINAECCLIGDILPLPPPYDLAKIGTTRAIVVHGALVGSNIGQNSLPKCFINDPLSVADYEELKAARKYILFFGFIKYEGMLDFRYTRGFGVVYNYSQKFFIDLNIDAYNYERIEEYQTGAPQLGTQPSAGLSKPS